MIDPVKFVAAREFCERLQKLGVVPISFFHHFKNDSVEKGEFWDVGRILNPLPQSIPAYSVAELDMMLGNRWERPRLPRVNEISRATDPLSYVYYYPTRMTTFANMADAYADLVVNLIEESQLRVEEVNIRLTRIFS